MAKTKTAKTVEKETVKSVARLRKANYALLDTW